VSDVARKVAESFKWYVEQDQLSVAAFVVMPDHWHILFHLGEQMGEQADLGQFMRKACHWISRETRIGLLSNGAKWQDGFHETRIRTVRQFQFVRSYIENNPVRKEWVSSADAWPWSSANLHYKHIVPVNWPFEFEEDE
jgi:REP element-mobilizing transposase RayT